MIMTSAYLFPIPSLGQRRVADALPLPQLACRMSYICLNLPKLDIPLAAANHI